MSKERNTMILHTKFSVGDKGLVFHNNEVTEITIESIRIVVKKECILCYYESFFTEYAENEIFSTKKELLESL